MMMVLCGLVCLVLFKFWFLFGLLGLTWTDSPIESSSFPQYGGGWKDEIMIANYRDSADSDSELRTVTVTAPYATSESTTWGAS